MLHASRAIEHARVGREALTTPSSRGLVALGIMLLCIGLLALPWLSGAVAVATYIYPLLALLLGIVLYRTFPVLYVGYAWWLWFLAAFVARVVDYNVGVFQRPNLITLAPYLVTGLAFVTLLRHRSRLLDKHYVPFVLVLAGITYAYVVGIPKNGPASATQGLLQWGVPVFFGLHMALNWRDYPALRRCVQRTFLWGVAVMGIYAVIQFCVLPPWDSFWMNNIPTGRFMRIPKPFQLRVYSTLFTVNHFSTIMMAGLLVLFGTRAWKHLIAALPGYAGFVLTFGRSAWAGWLMALLLMVVWIKGRMRAQLLGALLLGALIALPLLALPQISGRIDSRFSTFQNLEDDQSFNTRLRLYETTTASALTNPIGNGLDNAELTSDSGLLVIPYHLGWPGLLLFGVGLVLLVRLIWKGQRRTGDPFAAISTAIVLAILAMLAFRNSLSGAMGATFWCFAGLALASYRYHRAQEDDAGSAERGSATEQTGP